MRKYTYIRKRSMCINFLDLIEMCEKKTFFCTLLDPTVIPSGQIFSVLPAHSISSSVLRTPYIYLFPPSIGLDEPCVLTYMKDPT